MNPGRETFLLDPNDFNSQAPTGVVIYPHVSIVTYCYALDIAPFAPSCAGEIGADTPVVGSWCWAVGIKGSAILSERTWAAELRIAIALQLVVGRRRAA